MDTPIFDFVSRYIESGASRLHMPGHKGVGPLGCEARDITEIDGADSLYEASGVIARSERNASALFGAEATFYGTEGSSQCVRAMLLLAMRARGQGTGRPVALAARNAHKSLLYAAALCDFDVEWLWPEGGSGALCACPVTPEALRARLGAMSRRPFCVFVTSPDYLGGMQDIPGLSEACRAFGVPLLVDNAHGAYLKFLPRSLHPLDQGADACCDSAHKTLPVLTGGAYLHFASGPARRWAAEAREALSMFGSTSPSYLILQSLDLCNARLAGDYPARLAETAERVSALKGRLRDAGVRVLSTEPLKLTLAGNGRLLATALRRGGVECEYADRDHVVLMLTPENADRDYARIEAALSAPGLHERHEPREPVPAATPGRRAMTLREAMFAPAEWTPVDRAAGRVCAAPTVSCPPAVPIAVSGEVISPETIEVFRYYGIEAVRVVAD